VSDGLATARDTKDRKNAVGAAAAATPGALAGWSRMLQRHGTRPLHRVLAPAIRLAEGGFAATNYLHECTRSLAADLARDPGLAALFLPGGAAIAAGTTLVQTDYAATLRRIAEDGPTALHGGALGQR